MGLLGREIKEKGMQEERKHEGSKQDSEVNKGGKQRDNYWFIAVMFISPSGIFVSSVVPDEIPVSHLQNLLCYFQTVVCYKKNPMRKGSIFLVCSGRGWF